MAGTGVVRRAGALCWEWWKHRHLAGEGKRQRQVCDWHALEVSRVDVLRVSQTVPISTRGACFVLL